jgi:hypothetical protein
MLASAASASCGSGTACATAACLKQEAPSCEVGLHRHTAGAEHHLAVRESRKWMKPNVKTYSAVVSAY